MATEEEDDEEEKHTTIEKIDGAAGGATTATRTPPPPTTTTTSTGIGAVAATGEHRVGHRALETPYIAPQAYGTKKAEKEEEEGG